MNFIPKAGLSALFNNNSNEQPKDQDCSSQELSFIKDETVDNDRILIQEIEREAKEAATIKTIEFCPRILATVQCVFSAFHKELSKDDNRQHSKVLYPVPTVLTIAMIARLCGYLNATDIALFYNNFHSMLSLFVCGMPPSEHLISSATVSRILSLIPSEKYEDLFNKYFGSRLGQKKFKRELNKLRIITFDGQENRAGYVKGSPNRRKKGNHIVSCVDGATGLVLKFINVSKKNQEVKAFLEMLAEIPDASGMLFTCDALNSRKSLLAEVLKKNGNCGLKIKGNSILTREVKALFTTEDLPIYAEETLVVQSGGKIAEHKLEVVKITEDNIPEVKNWPGLKTAVKVTTNRHKVIAGKVVKSTCREYFMVFTIDDIEAIKDTILQSWTCETMHYTNDMVFLSDKLAITNKKHIAGQNALNKAAYNVLKVQINSNESGKKCSFKELILRNSADPKQALKDLYDYIVKELGFKVSQILPCKEFGISKLIKGY